MHIPSKYLNTNTEELVTFAQNYPFATLFVQANEELDAHHLPFHVHFDDKGEFSFQSHIAKANPLWKSCVDGQKILLVFHGPSGYVSPNYYPSKEKTGRAVPTWNYSAVHVKGRIRFLHDTEWLMTLFQQISDSHEKSQATPWSVSDAPADYTQKLSKAVVGIEIDVEEIIGQFKLSQDKKPDDFNGVIDGLEQSGDAQAMAVSKQMKLLKRN